ELGVRLFVLTVCHDGHLSTSTTVSEYAFLLDKLSYELDILVFIAVSNYPSINDKNANDHPSHLLVEEGNFSSPGDSMNNLTIGAIGDNFENIGVSTTAFPPTEKELPTIYSRKYHLDYDNAKLKNKRLIKPDVVFNGGNYTWYNDSILGLCLEDGKQYGMQYLTAYPGNIFSRSVGTSFATPLVA